ncbi:MAG: hypothetical protein ACYTE8_09255 [Planctomycetota bacterium]|jgi:hypothetical protein
MSPNSSEYIGFIRYKGKPVEKGYLDARKSAKALLGFDEAVRYFVGKQDEELAKIDYEIPVRIKKGSWEAIIPHDINTWIATAIGLAATTYLTAAAAQVAQNDFKDVNTVKIFKKSIKAMQWLLRLGKHLGTITKKTYDGLKWGNNNQNIGIPNENGEYLYIPKNILDLIEQIPANLLRKISSIVTEAIKLEIGVREKNKDDVESLEISHKSIFCPEEEVLFPELKDGVEVKLDGLVTRGNENANSIGFQYKGHILTCYPREGSIVRFKPGLFVKCEITGKVTRKNKFGEPIEIRPKIIFNKLEPIEENISKEKQIRLFDDDIKEQ